MRYLAAMVLSVFLIGVCLDDASAVLIGTGTGTGNTTAPADDPGFANVGICGSGSAIYLGNGWVLTAAHVYDGSGGLPSQTWFNGTFYNVVPGSGIQLENPTGVAPTEYTDLEMFRLATTPNLPSLTISAAPAAAGWQVVMVGNGRDRVNNQLAYWTPAWLPSSTPTSLAGDIWGTTQDIRWGTNVIDGPSTARVFGFDSEMAFTTTFDQRGTAFEAQGTPGDSGGAVFHKDTKTGTWSLAGVMFETTALASQPFGISVFGNSTYSADLSAYRTEISQIMSPPGDVNGDGVVNLQDLAIVASNWLKTTKGGVAPVGDVNHDGIVNGQDLAIISSALSLSQQGAGMSVAAVPEPSSWVLAVAGLASLYLLRRTQTWQSSRPRGTRSKGLVARVTCS